MAFFSDMHIPKPAVSVLVWSASQYNELLAFSLTKEQGLPTYRTPQPLKVIITGEMGFIIQMEYKWMGAEGK
jgi:hypothetical protein